MKNSEKHIGIQYVLIMPEPASDWDATPFQGWNPVVLNDNFILLLHYICILPFHTSEIFMTQAELLDSRRFPQERTVIAIGENICDKLSFRSPDVLTVYVCMHKQLPIARINQSLGEGPFLSLSTNDDAGAINIAKGNFEVNCIDKGICEALDMSTDGLRLSYDTKIEAPLGHGVTRPNLLLLRSSGFDVIEKMTGILPESDDDVFKLIADTAEVTAMAINKREEIPFSGVILYCPAVKAGWYDFKSHLWNQLLRDVPKKFVKHFIEAVLFRNKGYSRVGAIKGASFEDFQKDETIRYIAPIRLSELAVTTATIGLMSSSRQIPSIRLPNSLNLHGKELTALEAASKASGNKAERNLQTRFSNLIKNMKDEIGLPLQQLILGTKTCTLCCDAPIEWIYLNDLPLMLSHEVSRIPMTPGNMLLQLAATGEVMTVPEQFLRNVLVIRSFADDDPIKLMLEKGIKKIDLGENIRVNIVDVRSQAEAISALNKFEGGIVIFDCHGNHGGLSDEGWLQFGDDKVVTWNLAHIARIPPIVILSACLTNAAAGSHASASSGLLRSGAVSVLGTYLPVSGLKSAVFVSRLLLRIDALTEFLKQAGMAGFSWRTFLSTFLRMSYTTDVLDYFVSLSLIDGEAMKKIHAVTNSYIDGLDDKWYEVMLKNVAEASGRAQEDLSKIIKEKNPFMETLNYCQIGLPERLYVIFDEK